jgi:hypothetical protein
MWSLWISSEFDSSSNRNRSQKSSWRTKRDRRVRLINSQPIVNPLSRKYGNLDVSESYCLPRPVTWIVSLYFFYTFWRNMHLFLLVLFCDGLLCNTACCKNLEHVNVTIQFPNGLYIYYICGAYIYGVSGLECRPKSGNKDRKQIIWKCVTFQLFGNDNNRSKFDSGGNEEEKEVW